jgi:pimeloyl-ACP methyl ester carboxylesterase
VTRAHLKNDISGVNYIRRRRWLFLVVCGLAALFVLLWRLEDHDLGHRRSHDFQFIANAVKTEGTLWLPDVPAQAAVVIVHGDGPQDRTAGNGYAPFINALLDRGIAVASWDKPGVGASEGDWLAQSMTDRAAETREALATLSGMMERVPVGAIGFSQAGWVLPKLAHQDADFLVLVGAAVSWSDQGTYFMRMRLRLAGVGEQDIERALAQATKENADLFSPAARFDPSLADGMSEARWSFVRRNLNSDARAEIGVIETPVLALWGSEDLNVDPDINAQIYRDELSGTNEVNRIVIVPEATHGLLKARIYNAQLTSQWPWTVVLRWFWEGRHAYAPGALDEIADWILIRADGEGNIAEMNEGVADCNSCMLSVPKQLDIEVE